MRISRDAWGAVPRLLALGAGLVFAAQGGQSAAGEAIVTAEAGQRAGYRIPRTVFGTFLEPIGNSTYNGLWAEILKNPSLEENLWSAGQIERMIEEEPALRRASELSLPLPWEPLDVTEGNRYEPRWGHAANSWQSLAIFGVAGRATGIRQKVYLPVHRVLQYKGSIFAKHLSGPAELEVSLRQRDRAGDVLGRAIVQAASPEWQKYSFELTVPAGRLKGLAAAEFVVQVAGDERVEIDQLSLTPADAVDGMDPEMVRMAKEMHTPLVRFGGNYTSSYHWRDGVGPIDQRVSMLNVAWGIPEYNQFGTDEFLRFCQLIGAEPQIALNLGSGTAEEAADWVRYVDDHWPTHGGLLWELGNELWGNWNVGAPTSEEVAERTRRFSEAVRRADPKARLIATGQDPDHFEKWNQAQLLNPPGTFDFLSTHFVVGMDRVQESHASPETVALDGFALPVELGRRLRNMQKQIDERPGYRDRVHLAFTEWLWACCDGRKMSDAPKWDNMGGAIATAGFVNMLLTHADAVPISDMTGLVEFEGIWKKRGRVFGTPAYYAFQLYASSDIDTPVRVSADAGSYDVKAGVTRLPEIANVPYLDVAGALSSDGERLTLFCVNRHLDQDVTTAVALKGFAARGEAKVDTLGSGSIYDVNDEEQPQAVMPVHSTAPLRGGSLNYTFRRASVTRIEFHK